MIKLTEDQLETVAKKYCEITGLDPNEFVDAPTDDTCVYQMYQWMMIAIEIEDWIKEEEKKILFG